mmetsp:Transcript_19710/g.62801  ORF Transcript_19710/g.62801 Transcript_19710/m.62801 type:complete len:241 (+) Transcript_19710:75-797(+)
MEAPYDAAVQPGFTHAFVQSFFVILATEIGDKTFFIAAIMAMRHSRLTVWTGAVGALVVMTVLSTLLGHMAPLLLPKAYTHYAAVLLFLFFGVRMLREAKDAGEGASDELEEVELELAKKDDVESADALMTDEEGGGGSGGGGGADAEPAARTVLLQAFTLTFLAEWGDRSQIATIALGAAEEPVGVTLGAIIGHSLCTGLAVVGGKMLASRISERMVLGIGGGLFLLFAAISLLQGPDA